MIRELTSEEEFRRAYPVMNELRTHFMRVEDYEAQLGEMRKDGYRLFAVEEEGRYVALAGIAIRTNFYYDRFLYVYDLITSAAERSKGHGERLIEHLQELARAEGCQTIALSSGVQRAEAHRFYEEKVGFERVSYVFKKKL